MFTEDQIKTFTSQMRKAADIKDTERSHDEMDGILLEIAEAAGCKEVVKIFNDREKYYA